MTLPFMRVLGPHITIIPDNMIHNLPIIGMGSSYTVMYSWCFR